MLVCLAMARKPRVHLAGSSYHVMLRGNGGQEIFPQDEDRYHLYLLLQEGVERFGHRVHAFCLMTNHLHLAVQVADVPLSKIMQNVSFRYTRWVNRREKRSGHLFQGRYKAVLVDGESYLLELVRYIHLNPIRAGLVREPEAYPWSGHRAYLGEEVVPWLTTDWVLGRFGKRRDVARRGYVAFMKAGVEEGHRGEFHRGATDPRLLGDERFTERVLAETGGVMRPVVKLEELVERVAGAYGIDPLALSARGRQRQPAEARAIIAAFATDARAATLTEVARRFDRDVATLSEGVQRVRLRARNSVAFRARLEELRAGIIRKP